jgi:hypothetical protein
MGNKYIASTNLIKGKIEDELGDLFCNFLQRLTSFLFVFVSCFDTQCILEIKLKAWAIRL